MLRIAGRLVALVAAGSLLTVGVLSAVSLAEAAPVAATQVLGSSDSADDLPATELARQAGPSGEGVWAVVIGIDDYPGTSRDLRAGVTDALDMDASLAAVGVPDRQRRLLVDEAATLDGARAAIEWLVENAGPDATAVVFFSGHVRELSGDRDGDGEEMDEAMLLSDDGELFDGELAGMLAGLRAEHAWLAVAGCYGGGFDDALAPGRVLTAAAPEGVLAYESDRYHRTYMVEFMIRRAMLERAASSSVQEAFDWAVDALRRDHPNRLPVMIDQTDGPLVLSGVAS